MQLLSVLALSAAAVFALESINVPDKVTADTEVKITIKNDIGSPDSFDEQFAYYDVYLTVSPPGSGYNPVCWLLNQTTTETTSVTVRIPASVGPDGSNYTISTMQYNTDPEARSRSSGFMYSGEFELVGGTGVFSQYETDESGPFSLGLEDQIPCSAYNCVRQCMQQYWPGNVHGANLCDSKKSYLCSAQCEGTTYKSWDPTWDDRDGDGKPDFVCDVDAVAGTATSTGARPTTSVPASAGGGGSTTAGGSTTTGAAVPPTESPGGAGFAGVSPGVLVVALAAPLLGYLE